MWWGGIVVPIVGLLSILAPACRHFFSPARVVPTSLVLLCCTYSTYIDHAEAPPNPGDKVLGAAITRPVSCKDHKPSRHVIDDLLEDCAAPQQRMCWSHEHEDVGLFVYPNPLPNPPTLRRSQRSGISEKIR